MIVPIASFQAKPIVGLKAFYVPKVLSRAPFWIHATVVTEDPKKKGKLKETVECVGFSDDEEMAHRLCEKFNSPDKPNNGFPGFATLYFELKEFGLKLRNITVFSDEERAYNYELRL